MTSKFIADQKVRFFSQLGRVTEVLEIDDEENMIFVIGEDGREHVFPEVFGRSQGLEYAARR